ncbi:MAG: TetR/AcrR family transcriptional regulator [Myxococcus sp.]|nr:TetR/AcrR family transcriptional regulator [Myxococcus sp.]
MPKTALLERRVHKPKSREEARTTQADRLRLAMAQLVGKNGYGATSIAQVIERAGVSRKTFYAFFADKQACFLEAYAHLTGLLIDALIAIGARAARDGRTEAQLAAYLEALSRDPLVARAFIVEVLSAGPEALAAREAVNRRFADLVFDHTSSDALVRKAIIGGVNDVVAGAILSGATDFAPLLPKLTRFVSCRWR